MAVISKLKFLCDRETFFHSKLVEKFLPKKHKLRKTIVLVILVSLFSTKSVWIRPFTNYLRKRNISDDNTKKPIHNVHYKPRRKEHPFRKIEANLDFLIRLLRIFKILVPSIKSKILWILILHTCFLFLRTCISLYIATLDGKLVKYLVSRRGSEFFRGLIWWMIVAFPATYTNSMIGYLQSKLAMALRTRLIEYLHGLYLRNLVYYKINNLDDRIQNVDQLITQDVTQFSNNLAELYSNLAKPSLDIVIYNYELAKHVGFGGLLAVNVFIHISSYILRRLTPPFGKMVAEQQKLEAEFRFCHTRLIENSEEIALYCGDLAEKKILERTYLSLIRNLNHIFRRKIFFIMMEDFIIKYFWGAMGLVVCALPSFLEPLSGKSKRNFDVGSRTEGFITNRRLLLSSADAFGRILYSYKEIVELAGYTSRVSELIDVFDDIQNHRYQKTFLTSVESHRHQLESRGTVILSEKIRFESVPIISPSGDILVKSLTFEVNQGDHLLIVGPNGCGKSSLFRVLGGLWPLYGGVLYKPETKDIFYIPQRPYLSYGTLRDQIIYPHSMREMLRRKVLDQDLEEILNLLQMRGFVDREGGWDAVNDWKDILSGGDKQRIAMARLFYHKPKFAILDECTSAVSIEIEKIMYLHAIELGITLLTVSHRTSLWQYHQFILEYDGHGHAIFSPFDAERRLALQEEKIRLELKLNEAPKWELRLSQLEGLLAEAQTSDTPN